MPNSPTNVPVHRPRFAVFKCSDGRLQLVLQKVLRDRAPGHFFKIVNAGPLVPTYLFYLIAQFPLEIMAAWTLKRVSALRQLILHSRLGRSEKAKLRLERMVYRAHSWFGYLAISGIYGAYRYAITAKGVRNVIIVVHEACGAHEENLGPQGHDLWNRVTKRNAYDNMLKLKKMPESALVENWHLWYVSFSKRRIQQYDHATNTWEAMSVGDLEEILESKLDVAQVSDLFQEVWSDPSVDGEPAG